ncbi:hypothetical protein I316_07105 [Kwoniella heveanensis BCC8398]|uniref:Transcriptional coactivator HFI1/ADA1 n=1 Tax=Kwoniella heveanensis BCC8398 TaxID=1296120 RepID=A0A1B9GJU5_9TREE|nr:hypothetical protein I316_07105 [Kwoniella heveanensis BCC8398]
MSSTLPSPALTPSSMLPNSHGELLQAPQTSTHAFPTSSSYQPRQFQTSTIAGPSSQAHVQSQSHLRPQASNVPPPPPAPARPRPIPFERMDTHAIKQELHDELGEDGLPYWKALNGYLLGQIGRNELESMVRSWFKGEKVKLHNKLLLSLLNNASAPPASHVPSNPLSAKKRKRVAPDDPEFDLDETLIEPKMRVQNWVMGMGGRERNRLRRAVLGKAGEEVDLERERVPRDAGWSSFTPDRLTGLADVQAINDVAVMGSSQAVVTSRSVAELACARKLHEREFKLTADRYVILLGSLIPPLALPSRHLPSSTQLSLRLSQYAKQHSLSLSADAADDIGEFMAVGIDSQLGDVLHEIVSLTAHDRPSGDTVCIPPGTRSGPRNLLFGGPGQEYKIGSNQNDRQPSVDGFALSNGITSGRGGESSGGITGGHINGVGEIPKPDLSSFQHLFILNQGLHPQVSPALHRLANSQTLAEVEMNTPPVPAQAQVESQPQSAVGFGSVQASSMAMANRSKDNILGLANGTTVRPAGAGQAGSGPAMTPAVKAEIVTQNLLASGLLKIDKAGRQSEVDGAGEGKKERKHNLHWKYEDPALILKDVLG